MGQDIKTISVLGSTQHPRLKDGSPEGFPRGVMEVNDLSSELIYLRVPILI